MTDKSDADIAGAEAIHETSVSSESLRFKEDAPFPTGVLVNSLIVILLFAVIGLVLANKYRDKVLQFLENIGLQVNRQKGFTKKRPRVESIRLSSKTVLHLVEHGEHTLAVAESPSGVAIEKLDRPSEQTNTTESSGEEQR